MATTTDEQFPCTLTLRIPFPTPALSSIALRALAVDAELSPLVHRSFSIDTSSENVLQVNYAATTNRMLRVAVNGFFESLGVVVGVMEECDVDVIHKPAKEQTAGLGVQGLVEVPEVKTG